MSLIELWNSNRESIQDKQIQQVISFAGNGKLSDDSETSREFRAFLSYLPSSLLSRYANECLTTKFEQNGFALQDIVNEIGKRISFDVRHGLYRGRVGSIGFDGIWKSATVGDIIVEVKTTDAYRIDLTTLATYKQNLAKADQISAGRSSILIVVGRQDTGDLEAQIRGSRYAWDIRLVSVEALLRLLQVKETVEEPTIIRKIHSILVPQEFTRVDGIIDIVFSTAEDLSSSAVIGVEEDETGSEEAPQSERPQPVAFHEQAIARISDKLKIPLTKQSRTTYRSPQQDLVVSCSISREYIQQNHSGYWFAFHPSQKAELEKAEQAFAGFACGSEEHIFLIPFDAFVNWLPGLHQTIKEPRSYWHVRIRHEGEQWILERRKGYTHVDISPYDIASLSIQPTMPDHRREGRLDSSLTPY